MRLAARLTCPSCGASSIHEMPQDACQFFLDCPDCARVLRPRPGDCCVFCSYADTPCPPVQAGGGCCGMPETNPTPM